MGNKSSLIKKQRERLDKICERYQLTLSEVARETALASTTLTRWYNGNPKHALSATTWDKINVRFPSGNGFDENNSGELNPGLTDTEVGMLSAMKAVIMILSNYDVIRQNDLKNVFRYQQKDFRMRAQSGAAAVMDQLIEFLNDSSPEEIPQKSHKPSPQAKDQS